MQVNKPEKRHESRLKKLWRSPKATSPDESTGAESPTQMKGQKLQQLQLSPVFNKPTCSLPLLQVWPSQDSPRGQADGQSFVFGSYVDESGESNENERRDSSFSDQIHGRDSGIDSSQASPSPNTVTYLPNGSPTPSLNNGSKQRRPSSALLHPDHARLLPPPSRGQISPDQSSTEDLTEYLSNASLKHRGELSQQFYLASPSITSSTTSIAASSSKSHRFCDTWLQQEKDPDYRRRSSTMTNRYSLFDALDLECVLLRAAARGSVGPYSLSESLRFDKLTFTQSLAFPALARGLATKQRRTDKHTTRPTNSHESLLNTFAKVITAVVLFVVSILVFLVVYKFVRT
ncbi:uncharacterized protein LOC129574986 [Sitodiplosis mosellana]|uniref:uncharacterized protein LOC129574986 n=1 Tax=Sitodiplosis mosellana TaxID=263140 RepID=UPI0024444AA3|nr:uncharacterized protein LOC129574986 [Sitodiplosis mosellana]